MSIDPSDRTDAEARSGRGGGGFGGWLGRALGGAAATAPAVSPAPVPDQPEVAPDEADAAVEAPLPEGFTPIGPSEAWVDFDVAQMSETVEVSAPFHGAGHGRERSVVTRVRAFDAHGNDLAERLTGLRASAAAGRYFYPLEYAAHGQFRYSLRLPKDAARLALSFQLWRRADTTPYGHGEVTVRPTAKVSNVRTNTAFEGLTPLDQRRLAEKELRFALRKYASRLLNTAAPLPADEAPFGEPLVEYLAHVERSKVVADRLAARRLRAGRDLEALALADISHSTPLDRAWGRRQLHDWSARYDAAEHAPAGIAAKSVVYLMHNSPPFDSGGYASRAHGILRGFQKAGWIVHPFARPGYPADKERGLSTTTEETVDGVTYNFLPDPIGIEDRDQVAYVQRFASGVLARLGDTPVGYVQAASFYQNAYAGRLIADKLGVPLVYEMRGMDWLTRGSGDPDWMASPQGVVTRELEVRAAKCADRVLAITAALKDWLIAQGVEAGRIDLLPNGCSPDQHDIAAEPDAELRAELGLPDSAFIAGYIGSVVAYEGLENLVDAVILARELSGEDIRLLVVGDGNGLRALRLKIAEADAAEFVILRGRVPHAEVGRYYSIIDVLTLSRADQPVTQMISPLKPLEALAMGKPVISTDVAAVREILAPAGETIVPRGAPHAYAHALIDAARDRGTLRDRAAARRDWVVGERDWSVLAKRVLDEVEATFPPRPPKPRLGSRRKD